MSDVVPVVESARLRMRGWRHEDIDTYAAWCADEETMRYVGGKTLARDDAWRSMAMIAGHFSLRGYGMWAVEEKSTGTLVGRVGVWNPEGWPGIEIGWLIARDHRGKGYATEAAQRSIEWAWQRWSARELPRLISIIHVDNAPSIKVAERLGERFLEHREIRSFPCAIYGIDRRASQ